MARGAAQARRKTAKKPQTGTRKQAAARRPPSVESTMFFPRLRRQAKWVFVFLAFVFAAGFVFFGVGSGSTGIGDLLRGNFNIFGGGGGSSQSSGVKKALKQTEQNPKHAAAWLALATAYQTDGKLDAAYGEASTALRKDEALYQRIVRLQPSDPTTQYHLAQIADFLGDATVALPAYKAVVKLAPNDPTAAQAKQRIALLTLSTSSKK